MPPGFAYPVGVSRPTDIWIPYVVPADQRIRNPASRSIYLHTIARLKPGVSLTAAQAQMDQIAAALETAHPQWNKDSRIGVRPLIDHIVGASTKSWMLMLLGAVGIVLLIACANVANLLLARATAREREIGIRAALGAEPLAAGSPAHDREPPAVDPRNGLRDPVGWWAVEILRNAMPESLPRVTAIALDLRVLAAAAGLSLITGVLFGAVPALQSSRPDVSTALKDGGRSSAGGTRQRLRATLVIAEVALAVVLLVGAALFIGSFVLGDADRSRIQPGKRADGADLAAIPAPQRRRRARPIARPRSPRSSSAFAGIRESLNASMGAVPLSGSNIISTSVTIPGRLDLTAGESIGTTKVTPDYHNALKIPLRRGRLFEPTDRQGAPPVAIINESAAKKYFPGEDPIGRSIALEGDARTIVGIVGDVHQSSFEMAPRTEAYIPMEQSLVVGSELVIRTRGNPYDVLPQVKAAVFAVLPDVPLRNIRTMDELIAVRVAQRKVSMLLLGLFGVLGLVISAIGIYGVMALSRLPARA